MQRKIVLRNKRNYKDKQELNLEEFKNKFSKELDFAIEIFVRDCMNKDIILPSFMTKNKDYESDFYSDLRTNFNFNTISNWYIDRII